MTANAAHALMVGLSSHREGGLYEGGFAETVYADKCEHPNYMALAKERISLKGRCVCCAAGRLLPEGWKALHHVG